MRSRPFTWDDVPLLHELVARRWTVDGPRGQMRIGDFYWTLRATPDRDPLRHMQVWSLDEGSLLAVAWLDPPEVGDVIVSPDAEAMFDEALDWLEEEHRIAGGGGVLSIVSLASDQSRAGALRGRGYAPGEGGNVRFWRTLEPRPSRPRCHPASPYAVSPRRKTPSCGPSWRQRRSMRPPSRVKRGVP